MEGAQNNNEVANSNIEQNINEDDNEVEMRNVADEGVYDNNVNAVNNQVEAQANGEVMVNNGDEMNNGVEEENVMNDGENTNAGGENNQNNGDDNSEWNLENYSTAMRHISAMALQVNAPFRVASDDEDDEPTSSRRRSQNEQRRNFDAHIAAMRANKGVNPYLRNYNRHIFCHTFGLRLLTIHIERMKRTARLEKLRNERKITQTSSEERQSSIVSNKCPIFCDCQPFPRDDTELDPVMIYAIDQAFADKVIDIKEKTAMQQIVEKNQSEEHLEKPVLKTGSPLPDLFPFMMQNGILVPIKFRDHVHRDNTSDDSKEFAESFRKHMADGSFDLPNEPINLYRRLIRHADLLEPSPDLETILLGDNRERVNMAALDPAMVEMIEDMYTFEKIDKKMRDAMLRDEEIIQRMADSLSYEQKYKAPRPPTNYNIFSIGDRHRITEKMPYNYENYRKSFSNSNVSKLIAKRRARNEPIMGVPLQNEVETANTERDVGSEPVTLKNERRTKRPHDWEANNSQKPGTSKVIQFAKKTSHPAGQIREQHKRNKKRNKHVARSGAQLDIQDPVHHNDPEQISENVDRSSASIISENSSKQEPANDRNEAPREQAEIDNVAHSMVGNGRFGMSNAMMRAMQSASPYHLRGGQTEYSAITSSKKKSQSNVQEEVALPTKSDLLNRETATQPMIEKNLQQDMEKELSAKLQKVEISSNTMGSMAQNSSYQCSSMHSKRLYNASEITQQHSTGKKQKLKEPDHKYPTSSAVKAIKKRGENSTVVKLMGEDMLALNKTMVEQCQPKGKQLKEVSEDEPSEKMIKLDPTVKINGTTVVITDEIKESNHTIDVDDEQQNTMENGNEMVESNVSHEPHRTKKQDDTQKPHRLQLDTSVNVNDETSETTNTQKISKKRQSDAVLTAGGSGSKKPKQEMKRAIKSKENVKNSKDSGKKSENDDVEGAKNQEDDVARDVLLGEQLENEDHVPINQSMTDDDSSN